jgi:Amt family ammonium transporter|tara:strand:+ start:295 stop:1590 length:1296 start_codon:yes stop_codon:yes gene_type:complete
MNAIKQFVGRIGLAAAGLVLASGHAAAAEAKLDTGDTAWMLTSTALVLMMTIPGVAMFYGGMVRKNNVLAIAVQSFAICCLISVIWMVAGYSLAFAEGNPFVGGLDMAFLAGMTVDTLNGTIPESVFVIFQMTFAIITPALITGAFADRMKFSSMLVFIALWSLVVYSPITHWVWGPGGFLGNAGVLDFAGGTVVHINSGVAGLVAALVIGKRTGYGAENMAPHNLTLSLIGASLLWVGWFGFNAGSAVAANGSAGMAMAVTQIATAAAALAWMICEWATLKKPSVLGLVSGAVAGLVAITPASGFVGPGGALAIGATAGIVCWWASTQLKIKLGYDDSLDVFGIHGVGGIVGALLTGVFAVKAIGGTPGLIEGNAGQVVTQLLGIGATIVYCAVATFIILKIVDAIMGLRVTEEDERDGLDFNLHGETVH